MSVSRGKLAALCALTALCLALGGCMSAPPDSVIRKDREYRRFLLFLCGYTMAGKNKHDDVPDGMAMSVLYLDSLVGAKPTIMARPF